MIKTVVKPNCEPQILVITPLKRGDKISKDTKKSIKRNNTPIEWISYMGDGNPAKNVAIAYKKYRRSNGSVPPFVIKIDNDINASRCMLDKMYQGLMNAEEKYAYGYCGFEFTGAVNMKLPLSQFNPNVLLKANYISFNSLIRTKTLDECGGFVTDDSGFRLLDWCLWLRLLKKGYHGLPIDKAYFTAFASESTVSAGSDEDYMIKHQWVQKNFIDPIESV